MSRSHPHRPHRVCPHLKNQILFLSRTALNIWHRCRAHALPTSKRFSLLSLSPIDYQAAQHVRNNLHHLSGSSEQIFGFHVVCGQCEGFVVRDGVVRNCEHVRESWCSGLSDRSREMGKGGVGKAEDAEQGRRDDVRISVQPPTPVADLEPETSGKSRGSAEHGSRDADAGDEGRLVDAKALQPVPTILRPGRAAGTKEVTRKAVGSGVSPPSQHPRETRTTADDGRHLSTQASSLADTGSVESEITVQPLVKPDALMQNWNKWSESWEKSVSQVNPGAKHSHSATKPHCDPNALMQEWREWSVGWERALTSR